MMNVRKLREQKDPVTGYGPMPLGEVVNGTPLDFTFDAGYNPTNIVETTNWITNEMSYRFYVVKDADTQP